MVVVFKACISAGTGGVQGSRDLQGTPLKPPRELSGKVIRLWRVLDLQKAVRASNLKVNPTNINNSIFPSKRFLEGPDRGLRERLRRPGRPPRRSLEAEPTGS